MGRGLHRSCRSATHGDRGPYREQLQAALINGFSPVCNTAIATAASRRCRGSSWRSAATHGRRRSRDVQGPGRSRRHVDADRSDRHRALVTNDLCSPEATATRRSRRHQRAAAGDACSTSSSSTRRGLAGLERRRRADHPLLTHRSSGPPPYRRRGESRDPSSPSTKPLRTRGRCATASATPTRFDDEEWARAAADPVDGCCDVRPRGDRRHAGVVPHRADDAGGAKIAVGGLPLSPAGPPSAPGVLSRMMDIELTTSRDRGEVADILSAAEYPIYAATATARPCTRRAGSSTPAPATFVAPGAGTVEFVDNETFRKEATRGLRARPGPAAGMMPLRLRLGRLPDLRRRPETSRGWVPVLAATTTGWPRLGQLRPQGEWTDCDRLDGGSVRDLCAATPAPRHGCGGPGRSSITSPRSPPVTARSTRSSVAADRRPGRPQLARTDFVWVPRSTSPPCWTARTYTASGRVVLDVVDADGLAGGRFALDASPDARRVPPTDDRRRSRCRSARSGDLARRGATGAGSAQPDGPTSTPRRRRPRRRPFAAPVVPWCNTWFDSAPESCPRATESVALGQEFRHCVSRRRRRRRVVGLAADDVETGGRVGTSTWLPSSMVTSTS